MIAMSEDKTKINENRIGAERRRLLYKKIIENTGISETEKVTRILSAANKRVMIL